MENHSIKFGSTEIMFSIKYRKRKSLEITVYPDGLIAVISPIDATIEQIKEKVYRKAAWIIKQLDNSGETHYYLGRQYRLKVIESPKQEVVFRGGYIEVYTIDKSNKITIKRALEKWYIIKAKEKFGPIFKKCLEKLPLEEERKEKLHFKILSMFKRWGSCTVAGNILLNPNLIKTSKACIEYVILHELCHLVIPYHNTAFYELQTRLMPDWRELKKRLDLSV